MGARLSSSHPTVEVRGADAQLDASHSILLALIARSLVDSSLIGEPGGRHPLPQTLDLAQWQAAKFGVGGNNFDPTDGTKTSASRMIHGLVEYIHVALRRNGDYEYVAAGLAGILQHGTGASIQRRHFQRGGFDVMLDEAAAVVAD